MTTKRMAAVLLALAAMIAVYLLMRPAKPKEKLYHKMSIEEIDQDIRRVCQDSLSNQEKMVYYSERFLKAPYDLACEGDGEYAKYERMPLLNFKQLNCMTYCEIVMALTLSEYYEDMFNVLQHIRYRQGIIGMATRNHYTMVDWLPANSWCLEDVTRQVGGEDALPLTRTISHKTFFAGKGITDIPVLFPDREVTIQYIPLAKLARHEDALESGDVVALIQDRPGIFSAHMLLVIKKPEGTVFRHASMSAGKVIDSPYHAYISGLTKNVRYLGMSFMRMKETIKWQDGGYSHGKFILPALQESYGVPKIMVADSAAKNLHILSRDDWGAGPPTKEFTPQVPVRITIHHSGMEYYGDPPAKEALQGIQRFHQQDKKWADVAYHFFIDLGGKIYQGRPADKVGDTATNFDPTGHIGICVLGNYEVQSISQKQLDALGELIAWLCRHYDIDPATISGHKDFAETLCPGKNLYPYVKNGYLKSEVKKRLRQSS